MAKPRRIREAVYSQSFAVIPMNMSGVIGACLTIPASFLIGGSDAPARSEPVAYHQLWKIPENIRNAAENGGFRSIAKLNMVGKRNGS